MPGGSERYVACNDVVDISEILSWLNAAPQLASETLNLNYLPSYSGWSLSVVKAGIRTDILGHAHRSRELKITRRYTIQNNLERVAVAETLEQLAAWAKENSPPGTCLRVTGLPEFSSRSSSGVEDFSITFTLSEL